MSHLKYLQPTLGAAAEAVYAVGGAEAALAVIQRIVGPVKLDDTSYGEGAEFTAGPTTGP